MDFISETFTEYLLSLRIVRIVIAPGIYENLITNLPDVEFDMDDLKNSIISDGHRKMHTVT